MAVLKGKALWHQPVGREAGSPVVVSTLWSELSATQKSLIGE